MSGSNPVFLICRIKKSGCNDRSKETMSILTNVWKSFISLAYVKLYLNHSKNVHKRELFCLACKKVSNNSTKKLFVWYMTFWHFSGGLLPPCFVLANRSHPCIIWIFQCRAGAVSFWDNNLTSILAEYWPIITSALVHSGLI